MKLYKITVMTLGLAYGSLTSVFVYAQSKSIKKNKVIVGFQSGSNILFNTSKQNTQKVTATSSIVFRKPISEHFKAEAMLSYSIFQNQCCIDRIFGRKPIDIIKESKLSIPITMQYYPLQQKSRLQPYVGAGLQYASSFSNNTSSTLNGDYHVKQRPEEGTKYISIVFTQGVTYKVNTKIQLYQSIHFLPTADKTLGVDVGIGYTLP